MADILHKVGIKSASPGDAFKALTTLEGLSGWWTNDTRGDTKPGGTIQFRFGAGGIDMKVLELDPARRVEWLVVDGPQEWIGTKVSFDLRQEGDWTIVLHRPVQATRLEGAGRVHAPLQHQMGRLPLEPEVVA